MSDNQHSDAQPSRSQKDIGPVQTVFDYQDLDTQNLFAALDMQSREYLTVGQIWDALNKAGIFRDDPRISKFADHLHSIDSASNPSERIIRYEEFKRLVSEATFVKRALSQDIVIPDFSTFSQEITEIFDSCAKKNGGKVANYIPQLARVNPDQYAVSICTIDGQRFSYGDCDTFFGLQSTCKPINYCIAHEELGESKVHSHIGREPSGRSFNEMALNNDGLPHNPLINAGGIMCAALIKRELNKSDRFEHVLSTWKALSGGVKPNFNNSVYLSERQTADRNFALAYFMRENKAFPPNTDVVDTLEFYFQCCAIEVTAPSMASAAATLANGGINPFTGVKVFDSLTVKNCLSLMNSCGMYDFSGEFAFKIGLPAKSSVSGALMVVIPRVMGICIWSPRLDELGNSVRGVEFCKQLGEKYNFHNYDILVDNNSKKDPTRHKYESKLEGVIELIWAASAGDIEELQRIESLGLDLNTADYDGRTALHLAASEGRYEAVQFLLNRGVHVNPTDRWGGTPLKDAKKSKHKNVVELLSSNGGK